MEVESDDEDEKQEKTEEPPSQLDQDTQVQDMDEVRPWAWTGVRSGRRGGCSPPESEIQPLGNLEGRRGS